GDAEEIAEASSALFGGRIAALSLARILGVKLDIDASWLAKREVLKSRPGNTVCRDEETPSEAWKPAFFCNEEIPCNPCATVCPTHSIKLRPLRGTILDLPYFEGSSCRGCTICVAACPGLAMSLVRRTDGAWAEVVLPFEFHAAFQPGARLPLLDQQGTFLEDAELLRKVFNRRYRTWILTFKVTLANAPKAIGIRVQAPETTHPLSVPRFRHLPDEAVVCRCERITVGEIGRFIRENAVTDVNQLKTLRVGMGACGSKTCTALLPQVFRNAGVDPARIVPGTLRPLALEIPMKDLVNEPRESRS
ncbi:MAG TPA: (2Fe-2S)-binding protein, partial [Magnetospirillaceae bacterium]|nr:(2Fe-2S)-binding protein [Magnetospirillaceae bacterium]